MANLALETTVAEYDPMLMMLAEDVHRSAPGVVRYQEHIVVNPSATLNSSKGYQGRSPCLLATSGRKRISAFTTEG